MGKRRMVGSWGKERETEREQMDLTFLGIDTKPYCDVGYLEPKCCGDLRRSKRKSV